MSFIPHTIATVVFALLIPSTTASDVHIPPPPVEIVEESTVEPEPEEKPHPATSPIVKEGACNCFDILYENFEHVPSMAEIQASTTKTIGNVAVFRYAPNEEFPEGVPHVAVVREILPDGMIYIEEYNYERCVHSFRTISPDYHRLIGFTNL